MIEYAAIAQILTRDVAVAQIVAAGTAAFYAAITVKPSGRYASSGSSAAGHRSWSKYESQRQQP